MEQLKNIGFCAVLAFTMLASCQKDELSEPQNIAGSYVGTLTTKSASGAITATNTATADISGESEGLIQVHCYGASIDTTFMLNYYDDRDSIMVCLTGNDFQNTYGHMMGQGHSTGGMMGQGQTNGGMMGGNTSSGMMGSTSSGTTWQNHMTSEHTTGDMHYGGFNKMNNSFGYRFLMNQQNNSITMEFQGNKK